MSATRRESQRIARRADLVDAALAVFMAKGVAVASVDDIVQAAGVAKGTFYLYFASKDDVVNAVAERIVQGVADRFESLAGPSTRPAARRLLALGESMGAIGREPHERDLIEILHRPENRPVHDRMTEQVMVRLTPLVTQIIADGIRTGEFRPQDPHLAASFVLATFGALHDIVMEPTDLAPSTDALHAFVLRGLGADLDVTP